MDLISFNTINNTMYIYLIDNNIIIYDDDDTQIKIYKYTLKYKKIIAIILLIILLIIGYYYNFFNIINNSNNSNNDIILQKGGSADPSADVPEKKLWSKIKSGISKRKYKGAAEFDLKTEKAGKAINKAAEHIKEGAVNTFNKAKSASTYYDAGATAARKFKDNADVIYQVLYAIALFIVLCIITIPALSFFIIGIFCYFLLKDKMKTIKRL